MVPTLPPTRVLGPIERYRAGTRVGSTPRSMSSETRTSSGGASARSADPDRSGRSAARHLPPRTGGAEGGRGARVGRAVVGGGSESGARDALGRQNAGAVGRTQGQGSRSGASRSLSIRPMHRTRSFLPATVNGGTSDRREEGREGHPHARDPVRSPWGDVGVPSLGWLQVDLPRPGYLNAGTGGRETPRGGPPLAAPRNGPGVSAWTGCSRPPRRSGAAPPGSPASAAREVRHGPRPDGAGATAHPTDGAPGPPAPARAPSP